MPRKSRASRASQSSVPASAADTTVKLPAEVGIEQAAVWRERLLEHVDDTRPVTLDGRDVQQVHTAALQLFCMFCHDRRTAGRDTLWFEPSEALRSAAALLGVTTLLQMARKETA